MRCDWEECNDPATALNGRWLEATASDMSRWERRRLDAETHIPIDRYSFDMIYSIVHCDTLKFNSRRIQVALACSLNISQVIEMVTTSR